MKSRLTVALLATGLVAVLTWLLVQGTGPDRPGRERTDALQAIVFHNAALQRDVLQARAGLLRHYDPIVRSMNGLLEATAALEHAGDVAGGDVQLDVDRRIRALAATVRDQEAAVEAFKSENALLRNSLAYFNRLGARLAAGEDSRQAGIADEAGTLAAAMLRFANAPLPDSARQVGRSLDRLAAAPVSGPLAGDVRALVLHGRLVLATLPAVDALVARLQAAPVAVQARALLDTFAEIQSRRAARSDLFLALLYAAALCLVAYAVHLFLRLRANAGLLEQRLELESLVASISTAFINLPPDRIREGIEDSLARLVRYAGLDRAQIVMARDGEPDVAASFFVQRPAAAPDLPRAEVAAFVSRWHPAALDRQGCTCVPAVRLLADGPEKRSLEARRVRSWLRLPLQVAGEELGVLALDAVREERHWRDDDVALYRTAAGIFANAMARERAELAREELQSRLNRSQRLEAIGTLAGGIAHEFNNILGAIRGYGEMALGILRDQPRPRRYVEQIMKAGERAQNVVEQVLAFGRRRERQLRALAIETVVQEALGLARASLPSTLEWRTRFGAGDATVLGDDTEIQQVVMNLCKNAAQAMDGRGVLTVVVDTVEIAGATKLSHGTVQPGRWVRLLVADTGHGIEPAAMERLFEPFFTTRPAGRGTGLGLSTVHGIVAGHGGSIDVASRSGAGTTFAIWLPRAPGSASRQAGPRPTPVRTGRGETVLLVDDDVPLVLLGEEMLAALGYEPVGFDHADAALAAFDAEPRRFDVVLTDDIMPGMRGTELAGAIHEIRPDIPIVLMTGYAQPLRAERLRASGIREVLKKPLLSRALADCLARHLPAR